jgi:hypothetical protein
VTVLRDYDYGPPVGVVGSGLDNPQDNSDAVNVIVPGDKPHTPPADATIIQEPGGSPSEGATAPLTLYTAVDGLDVVLIGSGPGAYNGCEVLWGDGSPAEYPGPGGTSAGSRLTHTYDAGGDYTISVDPLGEMFPPTTTDVTVEDPAGPPPEPEEE